MTPSKNKHKDNCFIILSCILILSGCLNPLNSDTTAPADISGFVLESGQNNTAILRWSEPLDEDFFGLRIYKDDVLIRMLNKGTTSCTFTDLNPGQTYTFAAKAVDQSGNEAKGVTLSITISGLADISALTAVQNNSTTVTLSWVEPLSEFTGIHIYNGDVLMKTMDKGKGFVSISNLSESESYSFVIKTFDGVGNESSGKTANVSLSASGTEVSNLAVDQSHQHTISLSWTEPDVDNFKETRVYCDDDQVMIAAKGTSSVSISQLNVNQSYFFIVKWVDDNGIESGGLTISAELADITPPSNINQLYSSQIDKESLVLHWSEPLDVDFTGVYIYQGNTLIDTLAKGTTSCAVSGLTFGSKYDFTVKAYDTSGNVAEGSSLSMVLSSPDADFNYSVFNGRATITGYNGSDSQVIIPSFIDGKPLRGIADHAVVSSSLVSIEIPSSVTEIGLNPFLSCTSLTDIKVNQDSTDFVSHDGVLYGLKSGLGLVSYPRGKTETSYSLYEGALAIEAEAFVACSVLSSVSMPDSLTSIGQKAFMSCSGLTDLDFGAGLVSIGEEAFTGCKKITSSNFGDKLEVIEEKAFYNCDGLTAVVLPSSIRSVGAYAFAESNITSVVIGDVSTSISDPQGVIDDYAFSRCLYLKTALIGNSIETIGDYAFDYCREMDSLTLGNSLKIIGDSAFEDCRDLTALDLPDTLTDLGEAAFKSCSSLSSVDLGSSLKRMGGYALSGTIITNLTLPESLLFLDDYALCYCYKVTEITIPSSITSLGDYVFYGCEALESINIPETITSFGEGAFFSCTSLDSLEIPSSVTSIGDNAFSACTALVSLEIPDSVIFLGDSLMEGCSALERFTFPTGIEILPESFFKACTSLETITTLPNSIKTIESYAFYGCTGLTGITLPDQLTSLGYQTFMNCTSLSDIELPSLVITIGNNLFSGCTSLTSVDFSPLLEAIPDQMFSGCTSLVSCVIPSSVSSMGSNVFSGCSNLESITIPNTVTTIGNAAFSDCSKLTSISLPANLEILNYSLFTGCSLLSEVTFPANLTEIGDRVFRYCTSLDNLTIPSSVETVGTYLFEGCTSLTSISLPANITQIGSRMFKNCSSLTTFNFLGEISLIGQEAFYGCGFTSVTIPTSVTSIYKDGFSYCRSLTEVILNSETPPSLGTGGVFTNNASGRLFSVPAEFVQDYQDNASWLTYTDYIQAQ